MKRILCCLGLTAVLAAVVPAGPAPATPTPPVAIHAEAATPLLAYYYQWFEPGSWDRAKIDLPQLGRYSSDDRAVIRQHVDWAKSVGIDGFVVSWKDTQTNDRRLRLLMDVAREAGFELAMIYQGLDFDRNPLPVDRVAADFVAFRDRFAGDPVFMRIGGKPLTIWSGTWEFSHGDVARVTGAVRGTLLVLSTEKNVDGYRRLADVTDGDAYYWSSVNPATNRDHAAKLGEMGRAIHADGKYWIAPFAPGFDARQVGGAKTVDRRDGRTLRAEYAAAVRSSPDLLGLISWNEFSENTYVEPSRDYGRRYLDVVRELRGSPPDPVSVDDSSDGDPAARAPWLGSWSSVLLMAAFPVLLVAGGAVAAAVRRRRATVAPGVRD
jgi:hypothetical protein